MLERLGGAVEHKHIAIAKHGIGLRLWAADTAAANGGYDDATAAEVDVGNSMVNGTGVVGEGDGVELLTKAASIFQIDALSAMKILS